MQKSQERARRVLDLDTPDVVGSFLHLRVRTDGLYDQPHTRTPRPRKIVAGLLREAKAKRKRRMTRNRVILRALAWQDKRRLRRIARGVWTA